MAIQKNITIDGIDVPFKASATVPRLYRLKFRRDIYQDFAALQKSVGENTEEFSALDIESLEVFENIAYIMAKHADPAVPASPAASIVFLNRSNCSFFKSSRFMVSISFCQYSIVFDFLMCLIHEIRLQMYC